MQIRIVLGQVFSREVTSKQTGKRYLFREQMGVALLGGDSAPCKVPLEADQPPYAEGLYDLEESSFYVDRDRNVAIGRMRLRPVVAAGAGAGGAAAPRPVAAVAGK